MNLRRTLSLLGVAALCGPLTSCSPSSGVTIQASGATFPAPLYKRWFLEYYRKDPTIRVSYQPIGSGAGVRQFTEGLVKFAGSDAAMSDKEIARVKRDVILLPMTAGTIVLSYNIPGVTGKLRLSRDAYTRIALGQITSWDDEAIARTNPELRLPKLNITWVRRAEGSGTTYVFTRHLNQISTGWKKENGGPGVGKTVVWPAGIGGRGNSGVAALVEQTPGAIGYIEFGYAELAKLPMAVLENASGNFIEPNLKNSQAALNEAKAESKSPDDLRLWSTDPRGKTAYPIVTYTWICCFKKYDNPKVAEALTTVLRFCLNEGQKFSAELGYIPLPPTVRERCLKAIDEIGY
jgi:phosphate transport system substrate-binding protein